MHGVAVQPTAKVKGDVGKGVVAATSIACVGTVAHDGAAAEPTVGAVGRQLRRNRARVNVGTAKELVGLVRVRTPNDVAELVREDEDVRGKAHGRIADGARVDADDARRRRRPPVDIVRMGTDRVKVGNATADVLAGKEDGGGPVNLPSDGRVVVVARDGGEEGVDVRRDRVGRPLPLRVVRKVRNGHGHVQLTAHHGGRVRHNVRGVALQRRLRLADHAHRRHVKLDRNLQVNVVVRDRAVRRLPAVLPFATERSRIVHRQDWRGGRLGVVVVVVGLAQRVVVPVPVPVARPVAGKAEVKLAPSKTGASLRSRGRPGQRLWLVVGPVDETADFAVGDAQPHRPLDTGPIDDAAIHRLSLLPIHPHMTCSKNSMLFK
mmetsp:Transcript_4055/g.13201  ORF Transcript_4055/g.13201 Transcript_4055/m.13201 type:complete len:377 (+) Transcript_4055:1493-2623(+)